MRERIEAAIKDAYYPARNNGGTMHTAATDATDAVLAVLAEPDEATIERLAPAVHDAYLETCDRLGWSVKPDNDVPYDQLSDAAQALDRGTVYAVLAALVGTSAQTRHTAGDAAGGAS